MYCSKCGKQIADDSRFCPACGCQVKGSRGRQEDVHAPGEQYGAGPQTDTKIKQQNSDLPENEQEAAGEFKIACPHCGQSLEGTEDLYGQTVECPACAGKIEISAPVSGIRQPTIPFSRPARTIVNNTFVWILAFIPIVGRLVELFFLGKDNAEADNLWPIYLCLNIGLCTLDVRMLNKAGHSTEGYGGFVWFIPVYLYKRTRALKQPLWCFVIWVIAFGISLLM